METICRFSRWTPDEDRPEAISVDVAKARASLTPIFQRMIRLANKHLKNAWCVGAPQLVGSSDRNLCVIRNINEYSVHGVEPGDWLWIANLFAGHADSQPSLREHLAKIPNFPRMKASMQVADWADVDYVLCSGDGKNNPVPVCGRVEGSVSLAFQFMGAVMRGDAFHVVPCDVETICKDVKPAVNDPCPCGRGKKYKRCCGI